MVFQQRKLFPAALFLLGLILITVPFTLAAQPLVSPTSAGFGGETRDANYDTLVNALYANGKVATVIEGDKLWVPWFSRSDRCGQSDLQSGAACDSGLTIDFTHNCMVTDEFSQVGILVAMGKDQTRMNQFYTTVKAIASTNGGLPAWRIYRDGNSIQPCRAGINGNCDTASDGTARIIIALFTAAKNPAFTDAIKKEQYGALAKSLSNAFLKYEVDKTCRPSSLGEGQICYWLAAGSDAKRGGLASNDYAYTGYYADAITAMLEACSQTGNRTYCSVAANFTLNYLEASKFNGKDFTVPPGRSFKWVTGANNVPTAECTSSCSPVIWDDADATRAFGMCQANYYAGVIGYQLPLLTAYCDSWHARYSQNTNSIPLQYKPDGSAGTAQSGYFAQGLQALHEAGCTHKSSFAQILDNALGHYALSTGTWDYTSCFGVYHAAFAVRALGMGIGLDLPAFPALSSTPLPTCAPTMEICDGKDNDCDGQVDEDGVCPQPPTSGIGSLPKSCVAGSTAVACTSKSDVTSGVCRTMLWSTVAGDIQVLGCEKGGGYIELYRQAAPSGMSFSACLANGCVTKDQGFVRFIPTTTTPPACTPSAETCDGKDNDCDGQVDEGFNVGSSCSVGVGECVRTGVQVCTASGGTTCSATAGTPGTEVCDQKDNDCNGVVDDGAVCAPPVGVDSFTFTVNPSGSKLTDTSDGTCRTVRYTTTSGEIQAKACAKGGNTYELYLQQAANPASICVKSACVGPATGFASFTA